MSDSMECKHCGEPLDGLIGAVEHHSDEHESERFDPMWYSDPDEWTPLSEVFDEAGIEPGDLPELTEEDDE